MNRVRSTIQYIRDILDEQNRFRKEGRDYCTYDLDFVPAAAFVIIASFHKKNPGTLRMESFTNPVVRSFMERANLFYVTGVAWTKSPHSDWSSNLLEVRSVSERCESDVIADRIKSATEELSSWGRDSAKGYFYDNLVYASIELMNNVVDHSCDCETNFITAQRYDGDDGGKDDLVPFWQVAVADSWHWILHDLRQKHEDLTEDLNAIKKAFEYWVSWKIRWNPYERTENAWKWLTVTSKLIQDNGGDFVIWSGNAIYFCDSDTWEWHDCEIPYWDGTFTFFNIYPQNENNFDSAFVLESIHEENSDVEPEIDFI